MDIIKVLMTKDAKGSPDGLKVRSYEKGKEYDLPDSLATVFIKEIKVAKVAPKPKEETEAEAK